MYEHLRFTGCVLLLTCLSTLTVAADELPFFEEDELPFFEEDKAVEQDKAEPTVSVLCQGRLRHGVFAIGCESTGTTITFHRMTWELQLPDEAATDFAAQHHGKTVVVKGTLRKVLATERKVRWIVDVTTINEQDAEAKREDGVQLQIRSTLQAALAPTGQTPEYSVSTSNQTWKLDFSDVQEGHTTAESLIGKPVLVTGAVSPPSPTPQHGDNKPHVPTAHSVRVETIAAATQVTAAPRVIE